MNYKKCEIPKKQTQIQPHKAHKYKMANSFQIFSFDTPLELEDDEWMLELNKLEVQNSVFKRKGKHKTFELKIDDHMEQNVEWINI